MSLEQFAYQQEQYLEQDYSDLTVIIPTLNEKDSICILLEQIYQLFPHIKVIVVDDDSFDGTQGEVLKFQDKNSEAKKNIFLLQRKQGAIRGITASVIEACFLCKTNYFLVMDADLQHPPHVIAEIFSNLKNGADIVISCREEFYHGFSLWRRILTKVAGYVVGFFLAARGIKVKDPMSGYFATKATYFKKAVQINPQGFLPKGYKVLFDFLKIISSNKFKEFCQQEKINKLDIRQVFYKFESRQFGQSKLRFSHAYWLFRSVFS